jgi:putative endonuclease
VGIWGKVASQWKNLVSGEWGEKVAEQELKKAGFSIVGRRVRFGPRAELDLVARDGDVLVFVEVKTRKGEMFGRPSAAVDRKKRRLVSRAAVRYLQRLKNPRVFFRFDVVEVIGEPGDKNPEVRHIRNAFPLSAPYRI